MNVVVESTPDYSLSAFRSALGTGVVGYAGLAADAKMKDHQEEMQTEFLYLLFGLQRCDNKEQCIRFVKNLYAKHFQWGWGSNHLWIKQRGGGYTYPDRLLFIEFKEA